MTLPEGWDQDEMRRARSLAAELRRVAGAPGRMVAVRAPGRVNLIGEHTDYSGLPVMPVAIDRSTIVAASPRKDAEVELFNLDGGYGPRRFSLARQIEPFEPGDWGNYVKAAFQGVIDRFAAGREGLEGFSGATMFIDGRVPQAAGLSSSAALTVASALAFMGLNGFELPAIETAQMVARSEWYVGTLAGGMDQAASLLGRHGHALHIEFRPLRVRAVRMPPDAALVVANSHEAADKSGRVREEYNRRVIECGLAARIIGRALGLDGVRILGDIVREVKDWTTEGLLAHLAGATRITTGLAQAAAILGVDAGALEAELLGEGPNRIALDQSRPLELLRRARHVLSETRRVERAAAALEAGSLEEFGELMNASHLSLASDFEVSTERLDRMVECARKGGALGARLTGAGFGGSIVALCRASESQAVLAELDRGYYGQLGAPVDRDSSRAVLRAGPGASVIELP